ncbi:MAG TPA: peptidoglycan-binding protein, partial [Pyrinomonadaceae bacterium]|nr:peptidoglycan-binding protein [Pyrinomonadaceae bacterium]
MAPESDVSTRTVTDGGVAGKHPPIILHPIFVGPSTNGEFNAIEDHFAPEACVRLDDVRFEFDSSIIGPEAATELTLLSKLIKERPGRPASIFGHADPVGDDDYNKRLSGRRAQAMYALITRKTALWEDLYQNSIPGGDNWGTKSIQLMLQKLGHYAGPLNGALDNPTRQAVRDFQGSLAGAGLTVDGDPGPKTREKLFRTYMDAVCVDETGKPFQLDPVNDFLARGADPDGKGDFQGCSEFNPDLVFSQREVAAFQASPDKMQRNQENKPNRRVVIYLFRKGSKISPDNWPCPRAKEGVAGCKKRFFSDGEKRRSNQALRRHFEVTKDTFACRFYDRIGTLSPCEAPPPPPPVVTATLEFVFDTNNDLLAGAADAVTTFARMGLWDRAFDAAGAVLNNEAEADNFIGADSRRFYLRVRDTTANGSVQV